MSHDHMNKGRLLFFAAGLLTAGLLSLSACGKSKEEKDLSGTHTNVSPETMAESSAPVSSTAETVGPSSSVPAETSPASGGSKKTSLNTSVETFVNKNIKISYPIISGMTDDSRQKKANDLLKKNALSILENYPDSKEPIDQGKDTLEITCKVLAADTNRITVIYSGYYNMENAAHPNNIFYSNTIDLKSITNLGLKDFTDAYTMAGYVLSDDVILSGADSDIAKGFMAKRKDTTLDQYTTCFKNSDFPLKTGLDGKTTSWPDTFSYEQDGNVYFTIPVSHALGDYVIVEYDPTTK